MAHDRTFRDPGKAHREDDAEEQTQEEDPDRKTFLHFRSPYHVKVIAFGAIPHKWNGRFVERTGASAVADSLRRGKAIGGRCSRPSEASLAARRNGRDIFFL